MTDLSKTAAGRIALSAIGEGGEEVVEDVLQPFLKRVTYDKDARFDAREAGHDFLVGAILGALGGGVEQAGRIGQKTRQNRAETGLRAKTEAPGRHMDTPAPQTEAQGVQKAARGTVQAAPVQQTAAPGQGHGGGQ